METNEQKVRASSLIIITYNNVQVLLYLVTMVHEWNEQVRVIYNTLHQAGNGFKR